METLLSSEVFSVFYQTTKQDFQGNSTVYSLLNPLFLFAHAPTFIFPNPMYKSMRGFYAAVILIIRDYYTVEFSNRGK
jgi:hypothetical protein